MPMPSDLEAALLAWLRAPTVALVLTPSDQMQALRRKLQSVTAELERTEQARKRLEFLYSSECLVNLRLEDEVRKLRNGR